MEPERSTSTEECQRPNVGGKLTGVAVQLVGVAAVVFTPGELAKLLRPVRSAQTVRRIADELRIEPARTAGGIRTFSVEQAERIAAEVARRERERDRR